MRKILILLCLLLGMTAAYAQQVVIHGTVYDDQREPAIGATIRLKSNNKVGTQSNAEGKFSIKARPGEILIISYIGFKTVEVPAKQGMTVYLKSDAELLHEVVAMGYGSGRAISTTTASVVKVTAKELASKPNANVLESLQGKVAGLSVSTGTGEPGSLSTIELHGSGSLGLGSAPLYILDGMPVGQGTIMGLNPNDYESVQVFKDASATAIYGSRAANGVIFITTKRGEAGKRARITVTTQYGVSNLASRKFYNNVMSADELADFWVSTGIKTEAWMKAHREKYPYDTNWTDYIFRKAAPMYNAALSISGGSQNTRYYLSGQHYYQKGLWRGRTEYTKSNLRANLSSKLNDWLSVYLNNGIYYDNTMHANPRGNSPWGGGIFWVLQPFWSPYDKDGKPYYDELIPGALFYNPDYVADNWDETSGTFEYLGNLGVTIRPVTGLTLRSTISADIDYYYGYAIRDPRYKGRRNNGYRSDSFSKSMEWTFTNTAEYNLKPHRDHDLTFLVGHEFHRYDGRGFWAEGWGLKDYRLMHLNKDYVTDPNKKDMGSSFGQSAYLSFFGRLSYGLLDRYYFDFSIRDDASSKFPPRLRHALFWSAGVKWNAKEEAFLENVSWINRLDAKISTGTSGNSALGSYAYFALSSTSDIYKGETSKVIADPGNPDLTWEKQQKSTIGIDGRFFNRLGVNFEVYHRLTTQMVMSVPYPYTTGISSNVRNVGTYQNAGFDLRLDYDVWRGRHGNTLSLYGNINYNKDKVLKLFQGLDTWVIPGTNIAYKVGEPVMFCMPIFKRVNPDTGDPEWYAAGPDKGSMHKDDNDIVVGNDFNAEALEQNTGVPRNTPWRGGFGLRGQYEGFYIDMDFSFFLGKHMISNDLYFGTNARVFPNSNVLRTARDHWKQSGDQVIYPDIKRYPELIKFDTRMLLNSSFMRLKALSIGYDVPQKFLEGQNFFQGIKVSVTGRNLLTFTKFYGPDPEPDTNLTYGRNPATRQFVGSIEITF